MPVDNDDQDNKEDDAVHSKVDWTQYIAVNSATAHPHYGRDGATYNMGNSYGKGGNLHSLLASSLPTCPPPKPYTPAFYVTHPAVPHQLFLGLPRFLLQHHPCASS